MPIILTGPLTGQELLEIDPVSEDAANSVLQLGPGTSYELTAVAFPGPPLEVGYASSVDTEGEIPGWRRYGNREITFTTEFVDAGGGLLADFQEKVAKLQREGGTLRRTMKNGDVRIYDLVAADGWNPVYDVKYYLGDLTEVSVTLPARPLARGARVDLGDNVETTLPVLVFTETSVPGDVPGLGDLVVDNDDATNDQWWATWGIETNKDYTFTDSTGSGALFYEAESRTAMGGSAIAAGPTGASGTGSNVMRSASLATSSQAILSTQATGGGAHLTHVGSFNVYARVQVPTTNTGTVSVALEWADGDFRRYTPNATWTIPPSLEGTWQLVQLGLVTIPKVISGTQRWEGRILAKSTVATDTIDVDWLMLVPADQGSGEVGAVVRLGTPTVLSARDEFNQTAGVLTAKTAPTGGVWTGAGDADEFSVETAGHTAQRTAVSDVDEITGRYAISGAAAMTNMVVQVDAKSTDLAAWSGVLARYVDVNNWLMAVRRGSLLEVWRRLAGTVTQLDAAVIAPTTDTFYTLALYVDARGHWQVWMGTAGGNITAKESGYDSVLATGGTLASGKPGFYDAHSIATAATRNFDNFLAWVPQLDAAIFASQSLEIRHDRVLREDSGGTLWVTPSSYIGDYLRPSPSGAEGRSIRVLVKPSRGAPGVRPDSGIDDVSARLFVTPRYL